MIIHYKSNSCWICYLVIDHGLIDFLQKSQKSLDFGIVPDFYIINKYDIKSHISHILPSKLSFLKFNQ
jgi:hypothetical protein